MIFITAHDDAQVREEALSVGCTGYLRKVDAGKAILDTIERLAEERRKRPTEP